MFKKNFLTPKTLNLKPFRKAFTLVEVLVSIVILVVVISGVVALETGNIKTGTSSKYSLQANGLAQEGMNLVKAIGDIIRLNNTTPSGVSGECVDPNNTTTCPAGVYYIDGNTLKTCGSCKNKVGDTVNCNTTVQDMICKDNNSAPKNINGKDFYTTVIIP